MNSNFKNSCPLKLKFLPNKVCEQGKPINPKRVEVEPACPWWIASEQYHHCFWRYVFNRSDETGDLGEATQQELAKLYGCSSTKIHFLLTEALQQLTKIMNKDNLETNIDLEEFFGDILGDSSDDPDISNL